MAEPREVLMSNFSVMVSLTSGGTYTTCSGINNITWTEERAEIDASTFASNWKRSTGGMPKFMVKAEGFRYQDPTTGARDAGQKIVEKAARSTTASRLIYVRITDDNDPLQFIQFPSEPSVGDFGGGIDKLATWSVEFRPAGDPTFTGIEFDATT